jgi:hypothetical protein
MKGDSGALEQRYITTGVSNGNYIEIVEGLSDGDEVYVEAKADADSSSGLLSGLFGGTRFNQSRGSQRSGGGSGGFDRSNMPDFSSGERPSFSGGDFPGRSN